MGKFLKYSEESEHFSVVCQHPLSSQRATMYLDRGSREWHGKRPTTATTGNGERQKEENGPPFTPMVYAQEQGEEDYSSLLEALLPLKTKRQIIFMSTFFSIKKLFWRVSGVLHHPYFDSHYKTALLNVSQTIHSFKHLLKARAVAISISDMLIC